MSPDCYRITVDGYDDVEDRTGLDPPTAVVCAVQDLFSSGDGIPARPLRTRVWLGNELRGEYDVAVEAEGRGSSPRVRVRIVRALSEPWRPPDGAPVPMWD